MTVVLPRQLSIRKPWINSAWLIWFIAAFFYGYEFLLRVAPSAMIPEMQSSFGVSQGALATLSSTYFYAYALCQLPAGVLLDRFGSRQFLSLACFLVALGGLMMSITNNVFFANVCRIAIGAGSAFAFAGTLKLARFWLPQDKLPLLVGLTNLLGALGAILAGGPLALMVDNWGWRFSLGAVSLSGFLIVFALWFFIKNPSSDQVEAETSKSLLSGLKQVASERQNWLLALYGCLLVAPIQGFAEYWSVPFLQSAHNLSKAQAASANSIIFAGILVGGPLIGLLSMRIKNYGTLMGGSTLLACLSLYTVLYVDNLSLWLIAALLFSYGFFTSNMLLCFSMITKPYPHYVTGSAIAFCNMIVIAGGAITQPLIGYLLDWSVLQHDGLINDMLIDDFRLSLAILPFCLIGALLLLPFIRRN